MSLPETPKTDPITMEEVDRCFARTGYMRVAHGLVSGGQAVSGASRNFNGTVNVTDYHPSRPLTLDTFTRSLTRYHGNDGLDFFFEAKTVNRLMAEADVAGEIADTRQEIGVV